MNFKVKINSIGLKISQVVVYPIDILRLRVRRILIFIPIPIPGTMSLTVRENCTHYSILSRYQHGILSVYTAVCTLYSEGISKYLE